MANIKSSKMDSVLESILKSYNIELDFECQNDYLKVNCKGKTVKIGKDFNLFRTRDYSEQVLLFSAKQLGDIKPFDPINDEYSERIRQFANVNNELMKININSESANYKYNSRIKNDIYNCLDRSKYNNCILSSLNKEVDVQNKYVTVNLVA